MEKIPIRQQHFMALKDLGVPCISNAEQLHGKELCLLTIYWIPMLQLKSLRSLIHHLLS